MLGRPNQGASVKFARSKNMDLTCLTDSHKLWSSMLNNNNNNNNNSINIIIKKI
jgi:hypothetical protein